MRKLILLSTFFFACYILSAQPCKLVKQGMSKAQVLKLVGEPSEISPLGTDLEADGTKLELVVWHYGNPSKVENQRVAFTGDKVTDVISDGSKYDELLVEFQKGGFSKEEFSERLNLLNTQGCR